ncbi:MAG: MFS transporter, partial [Buchnera aphidicola]|nr:MFS transporter [Buchnera aphidicola]
MKNYKMNFIELQVTIVLCILFFLRMTGMFMIIPVLSHYGIFLKDSNNFLIGCVMGVYGISQIIFQIPFGILSDKYGRKLLVICGLSLFLVGNLITLMLHSIWGLIIGRFIQGSGAISGVLMALLSDFIREKNQKITIISIGISFALS